MIRTENGCCTAHIPVELDLCLNNFDFDCVLHSERDGLEHDRLDIQRQLSVLEGAHQTLTKERDDLHSEVGWQKFRFVNLKKRK